MKKVTKKKNHKAKIDKVNQSTLVLAIVVMVLGVIAALMASANYSMGNF